ncbi:MAG: L-aspartate oxidase [Thermoguttaceae bacterium]|nr:L-aspartate oxidase [Thermoguttaceae bacterium]MDW8039559.1 L-aspartate oxidase [Thermoguttaceae bacterium]
MEPTTPRYLVPFHPKRVPHFFTDVLIIGGGLAGLRAALAVDGGLSVLVITKGKLWDSSSAHAQGGIAGVFSPEDRFEDHVEDTLLAGGSLCERQVVEMVVREGPDRIRELIAWGVRFDQVDGVLSLGREGGHRRDRVVHALGDATGKEVMRAVIARALETPNIQIWENTFAIDLVTYLGSCRGALVWNAQHGKTLVWAKQTVLATGGVGQLYRETTNPEVATGDGMALAYRAGAELRDMEFMQFHPTVLYIAGSARHLMTEALRGEGAWLVDRYGHRFMFDYDPRGELAPRDIVSIAIVSQMEKTKHPCVYLDLTHLEAERIQSRFPGIVSTLAEFNIDVTKDRIPVRPGAHYMMGGVTVDMEGRTTLPGLWAAGEVTSSGLHGANRLASNSLLEALVFGARAGHGASRAASSMSDFFTVLPLANPGLEPHPHTLDLVDIRNSLKSLMWRAMGVRRDAESLREAEENIARWSRYVLGCQFSKPEGWELQNMLLVARLMIHAALLREESRGCHLRSDFPDRDDANWNRHIAFRRTAAGKEEVILSPLLCPAPEPTSLESVSK